MSVRRATCSCGALVLTVEGEPIRVSICYCHACQRRTGSTHGVQSRWARSQVTSYEGTPLTWVRVGDEGTRIEFRFCGTCGATLYWTLDVELESVIVPVGAFADRDFPAPTAAVYEARRPEWLVGPETVRDHWD